MSSILKDVKHTLGVDPEDRTFDTKGVPFP